MSLRAALLLCALVGTSGAPAPVLRVREGHARLLQGDGTRALERGASVTLDPGPAWVESAALSRLEVVWRGQAGLTLTGPAGFALGPGTACELTRFRVAEVEVRRGVLALSLEGYARLDLERGAVRVRRLPGGLVEVLNRGGTTLEVLREGLEPLELPAGASVRLRALVDAEG